MPKEQAHGYVKAMFRQYNVQGDEITITSDEPKHIASYLAELAENIMREIGEVESKR